MTIKRTQLKTLIKEIVGQTMQMLQEVQRGEWWIYPGGAAQFADGDVGDSGHEGYVIEHLSREIYEHFCGSAPDEMGYLGDWEGDIFRALKDDERLSEEEIATWENRGSRGGPLVVILAKLLEDKAYKDPKQAEDALYIAYGSSRLDARDYGMKYLGWKRMTTSNYGTEFQTWFLRQSDLDDMKRGIFDAWGDMGDTGEEADDPNHSVSIEVRANNKSFSDIPLETFERATVSDIVTFSRQAAWMRERKQNVAPVMDPVNFT